MRVYVRSVSFTQLCHRVPSAGRWIRGSEIVLDKVREFAIGHVPAFIVLSHCPGKPAIGRRRRQAKIIIGKGSPGTRASSNWTRAAAVFFFSKKKKRVRLLNVRACFGESDDRILGSLDLRKGFRMFAAAHRTATRASENTID